MAVLGDEIRITTTTESVLLISKRFAFCSLSRREPNVQSRAGRIYEVHEMIGDDY